jgi:hypothetical protein
MMRPLLTVAAGLILASGAAAQEVPPRYDLLHNPDLYRQDSPQETLRSVLGAVARDRYDYLAAHLLDPEWVDARMATNRPYFDRVAGEQIVSTAAGAQLRGPALNSRVAEVSNRLGFQELTGQIRRKLADEPDNLKELRRFLRDGEFKAGGETAVATLKDVKDRALYFKKIKDRWFLENRKDEAAVPAPPPKEKE